MTDTCGRSFGYNSMMFAAVLMMTGIYSTVGFNIYTKPVYMFENDDPLFGQTIVQSRDGILVPSPTTGEVFSCTKEKCSRMNIAEKVNKGLRPIASAASSLSEDMEQFLVCNQVRTMKSSSENLNGNCTYVAAREKSKVYPAKLASDQLNQNNMNNNNNNNNNKYQGKSAHLDQDHWRVRREAVKNSANTDEDDDDDEDAGTEIAFVLDGSGSIEKDDFEKAKTFISTVMTNVWATCFSCNFGIVQFGKKIHTELSLKENSDSVQALEKVKNITQVGELTKTASAIYHVLTDIFVPENGSNPKARKIIILLSDGEMLGDPMNLSTVLNMTEMKDITRFAIGVGPMVLNKHKAIEEMIEIAGSRERFYNVSNYQALTEILSSLENRIFAIEGSKTGAELTFELAEAGFSSHITEKRSLLFGAVGAYDWSGGIILKNEDKPVKFLNATEEEPRFSYLGYSVTSASVATNSLYISGAPRYNLSGAVFIFNDNGHDLLLGDQIGSYFGSVLCTLDINGDKDTDLLLVGAPHFHEKGEEGKVLVYKQHQGKFERQDYELRGLGKHIYARFGSAIADIGDIDGDNHRDVAVGAPLEESDDFPDCSGTVYIYNGFDTGIRQQFSQRITPSVVGMKLVHFGQALSVMSGSNKKLISVGSKGAITVFESIPVIIIIAKINIKTDYKVIPYDFQSHDKSINYGDLEICFNDQRGKITSGELPMELQISLDYDHKENRLITQTTETNFILTEDRSCMDLIKLIYKGCYDCFTPIKIKVNFSLATTSQIPLRVLDVYSKKEVTKEILFEKECKDKENCKAVISLANSKLSTDRITIGTTQTLDITFYLSNTGDSSYMTILTVTYPELLQPKKKGSNCEVNNDNHQITCKLLHPVFKTNTQTNITIAWQPVDRKSDLNVATITANLTGGNSGTEELDSKKYEFRVRNALALQLTGRANPQRLSITEGEERNSKKELQFSFKLLGENKYKAQISVTITITKQAPDTNITNMIVEPKSCSVPSEKGNSYHTVCTLTELQHITITADTYIKEIKGENEKITALAELSFDENLYDGKDIMKNLKVEVSLFEMKVVKKTGYIIGSAVGGFILLFIIIIILMKCGFFRRRHKMDAM